MSQNSTPPRLRCRCTQPQMVICWPACSSLSSPQLWSLPAQLMLCWSWDGGTSVCSCCADMLALTAAAEHLSLSCLQVCLAAAARLRHLASGSLPK